jgi:hypothetical protein
VSFLFSMGTKVENNVILLCETLQIVLVTLGFLLFGGKNSELFPRVNNSGFSGVDNSGSECYDVC